MNDNVWANLPWIVLIAGIIWLIWDIIKKDIIDWEK